MVNTIKNTNTSKEIEGIGISSYEKTTKNIKVGDKNESCVHDRKDNKHIRCYH